MKTKQSMSLANLHRFRVRFKNVLVVIISTMVLFNLTACQSLGWMDAEETVDQNTLAALKPARLITRDYSHQVPNLQSVIDSYTTLLPLLKAPETQMRVLHRLADLKLAQGENLMAEQAIDELDIAITAYQGLLAKYPNREDNDQVYYQLAKTYDLKGNTEAYLTTLDLLVNKHPQSALIIEVQFRRGELLFTQNRYSEAKHAFNAVISAGPSSFLVNAFYMRGWSEFKLSQYAQALISYTYVLDIVLPDSYQVDLVEQKHHTMVEDLLRVMGLSFSYLGGADSLEALFAARGDKPYEILVYDRYSDLLISKEQYSDAIEVYRRYIKVHPLSVWAPKYQINVISTLQTAGFKGDIYSEKVRFISTYGKGSQYWLNYEEGQLEFVKTQLEKLLPELANFHYVKAQKGLKSKNKTAIDDFTKAADYYAGFVDTFPEHNDTANSLFLLGESQLQLSMWEKSIESFERAGYNYANYEKAGEAAYASILAYIDFAKTWPTSGMTPENLKILQEKQQNNRLRFVAQHPKDKRAIDVLFVATTTDYDAKRYHEAITHAQQLLDWGGSANTQAVMPNNMILLEASLIKAHSLYALQRYKPSETAYVSVLKILPAKDKRKLSIKENLAASVFKQAEAFLAEGNKEMAISEFLRVGSVVPDSSLRASAEYDAATYLLELKQWPQLIDVLTAFRQRYPQHHLSNTLPAKLALAYRETQQWELAAAELKTMYRLAKPGQEKQDTLYIIAELYDKADNKTEALLSYRQYANTYAKPAETYMEAANRLAELYQQTNQPLKRRFWLAKQMKTVDGAPDKADDRMRYLAAGASAVLANDAFVKYKGIKLTLPLNKTMIKKTKALQVAMKAYQKTASYGVSEFSTEAGYRMADIYAQLSADLMDSDRPEGLDELELEQYEILLEEQAFPFEDNAIDIHEQNASRSWSGIYDKWVKNSFKQLQTLLPGRYDKTELIQEPVNELY